MHGKECLVKLKENGEKFVKECIDVRQWAKEWIIQSVEKYVLVIC